MTKSLSEELGEQGIRVNCVAPGPFWSPLQISGGQPQSKIPTFGQKSVLGRAGQPVELAGVSIDHIKETKRGCIEHALVIL